jgi:AI-2 transport protein TqsA
MGSVLPPNLHPSKDGQLMRTLLPLACFVVALYGLAIARPFLVPVVFAAFLAALGAPGVNWLRKHHVPAWLAVTIVLLLFAGGLTGLAGLVIESINTIAARAPALEERGTAVMRDVTHWASAHGFEISTSHILKMLSSGDVVGVAGGALGQVASLLTNVLVVLLIFAFWLVEATGFPQKLQIALGHEPGSGKTRRMGTEVNKYLVVKSYICAATGLCVGILLWIFDIEFAVLWGLSAFLLNYIPSVGLIIATVVPALTTLLLQGPWKMFLVILSFFLAGIIVGYGVEPALLGRRLGLSAFMVFMSLFFWGALWGPAGMFLAVPLTVLIKLALEENPKTEWAAILMDNTKDATRRKTPKPL